MIRTLSSGVWVGNDNNSPMSKRSVGGRIPARMAASIMRGEIFAVDTKKPPEDKTKKKPAKNLVKKPLKKTKNKSVSKRKIVKKTIPSKPKPIVKHPTLDELLG